MVANNNYQLSHQFRAKTKSNVSSEKVFPTNSMIVLNDAEQELLACMNNLFDTNNLLLDALKNNKNSIFEDLLAKRLDYSHRFEELGRTLNAPMPENLQNVSKSVLAQDQELMVYLERRIQKLRGDYQKLNLFGSTS
jgi:hypothetical protein